MYAIRVNGDKTLTTTVRTNIYKHENNADTLVFFIPQTYGSIDFATCNIALKYNTPDGYGEMNEKLERHEEPYRNYYVYHLPVDSKFTRASGDVELWLCATNVDKEILWHTSTTTVTILESKETLAPGDYESLDGLKEKVDKLEGTIKATLEEAKKYADDNDADTTYTAMKNGGLKVVDNSFAIDDEVEFIFDGGGAPI